MRTVAVAERAFASVAVPLGDAFVKGVRLFGGGCRRRRRFRRFRRFRRLHGHVDETRRRFTLFRRVLLVGRTSGRSRFAAEMMLQPEQNKRESLN